MIPPVACTLVISAPILARGSGGLSGPAIKPVAIRMVYEVRSESNLPIIGMGGINDIDDCLEFFYAGANALAIGTLNFVEPTICPDLITGLETRLTEMGVNSVSELVGAAHR